MKKLVALVLVLMFSMSIVAGCGGSAKSEKPTIRVGSKEFTEQVILGNIVSLLLEANGYPVDRKLGLGGTMVNAKALENGEIDVYVEYTGTSLLTILKRDLITDGDEVYKVVKQDYKDKYNLIYLDRLGFNNTYTLTMKKSKADELGIHKISDLVGKAQDLRFGTDQEFITRPDGYPALSKHYGFQFDESKVKAMDAGLVYQAVDSGEVDIIMGFATDGRIPKLGLINLEDDKQFFPVYDAAPVVRGEVLEANPEIADILNKLAGKLPDAKMAALNAAVDIEGEEPEDVARKFLEEEGLI